jgi:hypothetical protein
MTARIEAIRQGVKGHAEKKKYVLMNRVRSIRRRLKHRNLFAEPTHTFLQPPDSVLPEFLGKKEEFR